MAAKKKTNNNAHRFVLNCVPSLNTDADFGFEDALASGVVSDAPAPREVDLREGWWSVSQQGRTGACVGFAAADGVLRWHFAKANKIGTSVAERPSVRFLWMANKETDEITNYPTTFLDSAGTQTKLALNIARKYGCVRERDLPISGRLSMLSTAAFYTKAAQLRISTFHNLGTDLNVWRHWLANQGPILTRLAVDRTWDNARATRGRLAQYDASTRRGGHALCLVGYTPTTFIVRNSWGPSWGDRGFAYASLRYAQAAFTEAYGAVL